MTDLTVLVPYFNAREHIHNAITSICQQSLRPTNAIFYDDGSTDDSHTLVQSLLRDHVGPLGIKFENIRAEQNKGRGFARQQLISCADTKLVAWLDADDTWHPHKLLSQALCFKSYNSPTDLIVFGNFKIFDRGTGAVHGIQMPEAIDLDLIFGFERTPRALQLQTTLGSREAFLSTGFDTRLNWSEDHDFAVRFLDRQGRLVNSCTRTSFYVAHYNRATPTNWREVQTTHAYLLNKHLPIIKRLGLDAAELGIYKELKYTAHIYASCGRADQLEDVLARSAKFKDDSRFHDLYEQCASLVEKTRNAMEFPSRAG